MSTVSTTCDLDSIHEDSNVEELRARRVVQISAVGWCTWLFFSIYCWLRGYSLGALICFEEVLCVGLILTCQQKRSTYRRTLHFMLTASGVGLLAVSISHPALQRTILFFPVSILMASQLLGTRDASYWLVATIFSNILHVICTATSWHAGHLQWDELTLICGFGGCVFFSCQQSEVFYQARTRSLFDLSQRLSRKAQHLHELATTDSLTGLMNRLQFQKELTQLLESSIENSEYLAMMMIDMDGFKEINDTLGHPVGDRALIEVANRLSQRFGDRARIARLGGDEFCLLVPNLEGVEQLPDLGNEVCEVLTRRYRLEDVEFPLGASVGIAVAPDDTICDTELLSFADTAMFYAKERQLGCAFYDAEMTNRLVEYRTMQERLSVALEKKEFFLVYQPQVILNTGEILGVEALLRWRHEGEVISPVRFIPLLEKSREIVSVGRWIIDECCRQLREWNDLGYDIEVSINLSSIQFQDDALQEKLAQSVMDHDIDPQKLDFEITESLLVDDVDEAVDKLTQLKKLGVSISIDDFGTGYSSLAYLRQFPLDRLKIDRTFVKDIPNDDDGVIAASVIALAKALGLRVLAEGVETDRQLRFLRELDCDEYQGYLFSAPVEAPKVEEVLRTQEAGRFASLQTQN